MTRLIVCQKLVCILLITLAALLPGCTVTYWGGPEPPRRYEAIAEDGRVLQIFLLSKHRALHVYTDSAEKKQELALMKIDGKMAQHYIGSWWSFEDEWPGWYSFPSDARPYLLRGVALRRVATPNMNDLNSGFPAVGAKNVNPFIWVFRSDELEFRPNRTSQHRMLLRRIEPFPVECLKQVVAIMESENGLEYGPFIRRVLVDTRSCTRSFIKNPLFPLLPRENWDGTEKGIHAPRTKQVDDLLSTWDNYVQQNIKSFQEGIEFRKRVIISAFPDPKRQRVFNAIHEQVDNGNLAGLEESLEVARSRLKSGESLDAVFAYLLKESDKASCNTTDVIMYADNRGDITSEEATLFFKKYGEMENAERRNRSKP